MKQAKNEKEAFELEEKHKNKPHGWIQWKGTDVCMDIHCECGCHSHIDAEFAYNVQCPKCKRMYHCNGHIELIAIGEEPKNCLVVGVI